MARGLPLFVLTEEHSVGALFGCIAQAPTSLRPHVDPTGASGLGFYAQRLQTGSVECLWMDRARSSVFARLQGRRSPDVRRGRCIEAPARRQCPAALGLA